MWINIHMYDHNENPNKKNILKVLKPTLINCKISDGHN